MTRPNPDTLNLFTVDRWLVDANTVLRSAELAAEDRATRDAIRRARKELEPALHRARLALDDARLRGAIQLDLPAAETKEQE